MNQTFSLFVFLAIEPRPMRKSVEVGGDEIFKARPLQDRTLNEIFPRGGFWGGGGSKVFHLCHWHHGDSTCK